MDGKIKDFTGEDALKCGSLGKKPIKCISIDGPSDHFALLFISNEKVKHQFPSKISDTMIFEE